MFVLYSHNDFIDETFYIGDIQQGYTNGTGKPYLSILLMNRESNLDGRYWDMDTETFGLIKGDYARVQGTINIFNGTVQLKMTHAHKVAPVDMTRVSRVSLDELVNRLSAMIATYVPEESLSYELWNRFVGNQDLFNLYINAPAAMSMHHDYKHGLLEHSLGVASHAAPLMPEDERSIGTVAALLHDLGKVDAYIFEGPGVVMSDTGKMLGHIVPGVIRLQPLLEGFPQEFSMVFLNAIISHHGKKEWGSPELPKTRFAHIIHHADMLDSHAQHILDMPEWEPGWLGRDKMLGTEMYRF